MATTLRTGLLVVEGQGRVGTRVVLDGSTWTVTRVRVSGSNSVVDLRTDSGWEETRKVTNSTRWTVANEGA